MPTAAPAGANKTAGGVNGAAQLIVALMKAKKQSDTQKQLNAMQNQGQVQGAPPGSIPAMYPMADQSPPVPVGTIKQSRRGVLSMPATMTSSGGFDCGR